jgi:hypothetical protein
VASKLYGRTTPVVVADDHTYRSIESGAELEIRPRGDGWEVAPRQRERR